MVFDNGYLSMLLHAILELKENYISFSLDLRLYWCCTVSNVFFILSWNWSKALVKIAAGVTGLIWWMLHLFSFPCGVVSMTLLLLSKPETLRSKIYVGSNVPLWWSFTKNNWPNLKSLALVIFLFSTGSTLLFSSSSSAWNFHILSVSAASWPGWSLMFLQ